MHDPTAPMRPGPSIPEAPSDYEPPPAAAPRAGRRRGLLIAGLIVVALGIALAIAYQPVLRWLVRRAARERGVELEAGAVSLGGGSVTLRDVDAKLVGVRGLTVAAEEIVVELDGLEPEAIEGRGVALAVTASAAALAVDVSRWAKDHPRAFRTPIDATDVSVRWHADGGSEWLVLRRGELVRRKDGVDFRAGSATVAGLDVGSVDAAWTTSRSTITMQFGRSSREEPPLRIVVDHDLDPPTADITLAPTPFSDLSGPLGMLLPMRDARISGHALLLMAERGADGGVRGDVQMQMDGYRLPLPALLDGLRFSDVTTLTASLDIAADRRRTTLHDARVVNGPLTLAGNGHIEHLGAHARVVMDVEGAISCKALAEAAARSQLGALGGLLTLGVDGSVTVTVHADVDTRSWLKARLDKKLGIGCGLQPSGGTGSRPFIP